MKILRRMTGLVLSSWLLFILGAPAGAVPQ
jgi:hypothetical protein